MQRVCLIDYGAGNLHSAARGLERAADAPMELLVSDDPETIASADRLVLPGVGAFKSCAEGLRARPGVEEAIHEAVRVGGRPFLGICVGMQLLATRGLEHDETQGLDLIPGTVRPLEVKDLRLPHMGWNEVEARQDHPLLPSGLDAYFVHSFVFDTDDPDAVIAEALYGERFPAAVARDNVAGCQFHPEKSGPYGQALLANFLRWSP
ncbi:MAG: imidazole glycerol phosphate synthase subunit HisH [Pseudomonadota bacterium]